MAGCKVSSTVSSCGIFSPTLKGSEENFLFFLFFFFCFLGLCLLYRDKLGVEMELQLQA